MKKLVTICVALLFTFPAIGFAQVESGLGIGPRLGYYEADDAEEGNFYGGLQLRARLSPIFGIEGAVDYRTAQEYNIAGTSVDVRQVPLTASALVFLPISEYIAPYGVAGLGAYYTITDIEDDGEIPGVEDENNVEFGYHLGFGLEVPFNNNVALNADYRYIFIDPSSDNFGDVDDADFNSSAFTVGLMFYL